MRTSKKAALRAVVIISLVVLLLFVTVPRALGMASPVKLGRSTRPRRALELDNILPGDTVTRRLRFHNDGNRPTNYRVVLVRFGDIWDCDPNGYNLEYELEWSSGADRRLDPGETEYVQVTVTFPLAAGNACQGKRGHLVVREGYRSRGVYECRPAPWANVASDGTAEADDLSGHICARTDSPLHRWIKR